jgi:hypothetical protein
MRKYDDPELEDNRDVPELPSFSDRSNAPGPMGEGGPTSGGEGNSETPREREILRNPNAAGGAAEGNYQSSVPQSSTPRPAQGASSVFEQGGGGQPQAPSGVQPFPPMSTTPSGSPSPSGTPMSSGPVGHAGPGSSRLFGALGGLKGGGVGALNSAGPNVDQSVSALIQMLQKRKGLF